MNQYSILIKYLNRFKQKLNNKSNIKFKLKLEKKNYKIKQPKNFKLKYNY